ncbi:DUF535 domain-containing protein [Fusobacterium nucleatum]|jgi:membrane protein LAPB|uniref:DUF535 domain-containing protein n=1 Tax=Fusobacterium nucleatum TaxID=851 RepID=A0A3P1VYA4_FUSNU|nr:DUF535 family protein [Fusobacterium nucleatum]RRD38588.1 DUF535 domain-containing protein [Fusobacterium nucleatum]
MKNEILFYNNVMKNGNSKGEINTFKKKIKYIVRNLIYYKYSKKLAQFIMNDEYLKDKIYNYPVLCSKIHRPYITNSFKMKEKLEIIISSYTFLNKYFNKKFLLEIFKKSIYKICEIEGKNEEKLIFYFKIYTDFEKEGEFNIICENQEGEQFSKLTFSVNEEKIIIGGLQGMSKNGNTEEIKKITKNFYGVFPKRLVIEVLYSLFPDYDKIAVGNKGHIYLSLRYKFKKSRKINADYDEFWESLGSEKLNSTFWRLPIKIVRKSIEDVPSKKRSQYTNKYKVFDELNERVKEFLLAETI